MGAMRKALVEQKTEFDPKEALTAAQLAARRICKARFEAIGCAGQAAKMKPISLEKMAGRYQ